MSTSPHPPQLAIDIGNTVVKAAVFVGGELLGPVTRFNHEEWLVADRLVTNHGVKNIIYSTVANVPPQPWIDKWIHEDRFVLALSPEVPLPFRSTYRTMTAPPSLIVDAGTCATLDLIDGAGTYHGGNISPGLRMRLQAMHAFTARLPKLDPATVSGLVGQSTEEALRHGAQLGLVYEIEGLFARLQGDFPDLRLLLTGGDAEWLATQLRIPHVFRPHLVLRGLNLILSNYVSTES